MRTFAAVAVVAALLLIAPHAPAAPHPDPLLAGSGLFHVPYRGGDPIRASAQHLKGCDRRDRALAAHPLTGRVSLLVKMVAVGCGLGNTMGEAGLWSPTFSVNTTGAYTVWAYWFTAWQFEVAASATPVGYGAANGSAFLELNVLDTTTEEWTLGAWAKWQIISAQTIADLPYIAGEAASVENVTAEVGLIAGHTYRIATFAVAVCSANAILISVSSCAFTLGDPDTTPREPVVQQMGWSPVL
jgi:hypothetical protein